MPVLKGGTIRFIQAQPSLTQSSGYARAGIGTTDSGGPSYEIGAAFGGPIIQDELGFRVSAWHERQGGYIDHASADPGGSQLPATPAGVMQMCCGPRSLLRQSLDSRSHRRCSTSTCTGTMCRPSIRVSRAFRMRMTTELELAQPDAHQPRRRDDSRSKACSCSPAPTALSPPALKIVEDVPGVTLHLQHFLPAIALYSTAGLHDRHAGHHWPALAADRERRRPTAIRPRSSTYSRRNSARPRRTLRARLQWTVGAFYHRVAAGGLSVGMCHPTGRRRSSRPTGSRIEQVFGQPLLPGGQSIYEKEPLSDRAAGGLRPGHLATDQAPCAWWPARASPARPTTTASISTDP